MKRLYLSLGSNLGDRCANLRRAIGLLADSGLTITRESSIYETAPRDFVDQPWFLNMVVEAETTLLPRRLLARIQRIEAAMGRRRTVDKGPRTIDIDILLYASAVIDADTLTIPHPGMADRRFVLEPLAELAPELRHPVTGRTVGEMLTKVQFQQVRKLLVK